MSACVARLSDWLRSSNGEPWPVTLEIARDPADVPPGPSLSLVSMLAEAERVDEPWEQAATRIRSRIAALAANPDCRVCLMTVFRAVPSDLDGSFRKPLLRRIRRLNLLAVQISQEFGVDVADIDRTLADVGAGPLGTDYRLRGAAAAEAAGACIARTLVGAGLDAWVPMELQSRAEDRIAHASEDARRNGAISMTTASVTVAVRGRAQIAHAANSADERAAQHILGVLSGKVPLTTAWRDFARALARRGASRTLQLSLSALSRIGTASVHGRGARRR